MWICCNDAFVSIVRKDCPKGYLLVRARRRQDLETLFPDAEILEGAGTDYQFRAMIPQLEVVSVVSSRLLDIDYGNFKNSVDDEPLHAAYAGVWSVMARLQPTAPFSGRSRDRGLFDSSDA